jgi:hypothetical protein
MIDEKPLRFWTILSVLFVILPLTRFVASPTYELGRAVDMLLLFASGVSAGAAMTAILGRRRNVN